MQVYSPSEVADLLKIKQPTLRKYSIMLEKQGYNIPRNSQNHRYYQDKDIITLKRVIAGSKSGVTLEETIQNVISIQEDNTYTNDTSNTLPANESDITELKEMVHKQNELIASLVKRLDEQQEYLDKKLSERDRALMQTLNQSLETQKQIAASQENKSIWQKLFKKQ